MGKGHKLYIMFIFKHCVYKLNINRLASDLSHGSNMMVLLISAPSSALKNTGFFYLLVPESPVSWKK
jgi:hypothetical protein